jgi:glycosyltransferase involved in cell wall biosynthesis
MSKRVLLVISNLEYGGAQRQIVELANNMDPARYEMHICSLSDYTPLQQDLHGADKRLHIIKKRWKFDASVVPKLSKLAQKLNIDIIHSFLFDAEIASRLAGLLAKIPAVIGSERNSHYHLKNRQILAYRVTRRAVDIIIANSTAGATFNAKIQGLNMSYYRVVHNGVNTTRFYPRNDRNCIKQSLGISQDEQLVGMFASFKVQKNHPLAFAAMKQVFQHVPEARFVMIGEELYKGMHGSDKYRQDMDRLVDEMGIRSRCYFLGNRDDVEKLYCACDVTILPSLFEGTPNVLLESMACGVPVVATDVADNAKIVIEGKTGFLVSLNDDMRMAEKIISLLRNESLRKQLGMNARQWVHEEFSCKRLAEKIAAVYDEVLSSHQ